MTGHGVENAADVGEVAGFLALGGDFPSEELGDAGGDLGGAVAAGEEGKEGVFVGGGGMMVDGFEKAAACGGEGGPDESALVKLVELEFCGGDGCGFGLARDVGPRLVLLGAPREPPAEFAGGGVVPRVDGEVTVAFGDFYAPVTDGLGTHGLRFGVGVL